MNVTELKLKEAYKKFYEYKQWDKMVGCAVNLYEMNPKKNYPFLQALRKRITQDKGIHKQEKMDMLERTYLATAYDIFDDFMIALEWHRPVREKFWSPRREKLLPVCQALQDLEDDKLDELLLSLPPRVGKTSIIMFFLLWVMGRNSERSNLYSSYTDTVVNVFYRGLNEILGDSANYQYNKIFPEAKLVETNSKEHTLNLDRKKRYASFTGRSIDGTLNGACDCSGYLIGDDLISGIEEALNKDRLMTAWFKVENNLLPRAVGEKVKHLWIGTRWATTDPIGMRLDLLENEPKFAKVRWRNIVVPALDEDGKSNFDYYFGVGFSTQTYEQRRASFEKNNDMPSWEAQYMGNPVDRQGNVFEPGDLRYFNGELPPDIDPDEKFMTVDPAWGGGDFVASPVCYRYGEDIYVVDVVYTNEGKEVSQPLVVSKAIEWDIGNIKIEGTKMTASYGEKVEELIRKRGKRILVQSNTSHFTGNGKEQRIFETAPDIREHFLFLSAGKRSKAYEKYMENVFSFSMLGKNKNDDAPDSLAMASMKVFRGSQKVVIVSRKSLGF